MQILIQVIFIFIYWYTIFCYGVEIWFKNVVSIKQINIYTLTYKIISIKICLPLYIDFPCINWALPIESQSATIADGTICEYIVVANSFVIIHFTTFLLCIFDKLVFKALCTCGWIVGIGSMVSENYLVNIHEHQYQCAKCSHSLMSGSIVVQ